MGRTKLEVPGPYFYNETKGNKMRVTKLSGRNVKGCSFDHTLAPVTLFHGPNWAGKTARLDALSLALAGYLPGVASKPNEVFERVASGNPLAVQAETDGGLVLTRQWERNGKGSTKYAGNDEKEFSMPAVALDPSEFLGLSARERVKFLFSRCKLPANLTTEAAARALVANVKNIRLEENTPASEAAIAEVAKVLGGTTLTTDAGRTTQAWVEGLVELVSDRKKAAVANVQRMEKTMQGLTQSATDAAPAPADAEGRLAKARAGLEAASAALHANEAELRQRTEERRVAEATARSAPDAGALRAVVESAEKALAEHRVPEQPKPVTDARLRRAEHDAATATARVSVAKDTIRKLEEELAELQKEATCPKCGQSLAKLRPKMVKTQKEMIKEEENALAETKKENDAAQAECKMAAAEWTEWAKRQNEFAFLFQEHKGLQWKLSEARYKLAASGAAAAAAKAASDKLPELKELAEKLQDDVERLRTAETEARSAVSAADVSYKRLVAQRADAAQRARAKDELDRARAESDVWKEAQKLVAALQAELVEAAVGPLVNRANELCGGLLRAPLAMRDGELVMLRPGVGEVTHKTFSGTEKALAYAALSVALGADAPIRLAVIDEVGRLDERNRCKLVAVLCGLVKDGKLDQAVLVDTESIKATGTTLTNIADYAEIEVVK